ALSDRHLDQIVAAHRSVEQSHGPNYSVRYLFVTNEEREQVVREGKHFGLFVKNDHMTAFFPQYRADDMLETVRFRTDPAIVTGLRDVFRRFFEDERSAPLADLKVSTMKVG